MTNASGATGRNDMFEMMAPMLLANPYPIYKSLRDGDPVFWAPDVFGLGAWIVTTHALCSAILRGKSFIKEPDDLLPPDKLEKVPGQTSDLGEHRRTNMLFRDPPVHTRLRGLVSQAFTPRTVADLRPRIAATAEALLDRALPQGRMDLIADFAFPLPIIVIAELLGVPVEDRDRFKAWSSDMIAGLNPTATAADLEGVARAIDAVSVYLTDIIDERRKEPRADLLSALVSVHEAGDRLSLEELLSTCRLILTAGHETTVNLIGNGVLALLRNPDVLAALAADPSKLPRAVEELLRYDSPVQMTLRFAAEDLDLGGRAVKRGDLVVPVLAAANHDPAHFPDPSRLDIERENAHTNLAFGLGSHYCLGAPLARIEAEIAIGALLRRAPRLALASDDVAWRKNLVMRGPTALPVTF